MKTRHFLAWKGCSRAIAMQSVCANLLAFLLLVFFGAGAARGEDAVNGSVANAASGPQSGQVKDLVEQGRALYFGTQAFAAPAHVAGASLPVSAAACVSCHGALGAGLREGAQAAPDITKKVAGDSADWLRATMQGITRGQRPLNASMPRYELTQTEQAALAAYSPLLGHANDAVRGVTESEIVLGVYAADSASSLVGAHILAGVTQAFAQANLQGGVHGRKLKAIAVRTPDQTRSVFALVGSLNEEASLEQLLAARRVPSLAALGLSRESVNARGWVAPLLPSLHEQAAFLLQTLTAKSAALQCSPWLIDTVQITSEADSALGAVQRFTRVQDAVVATRPQRLCLGLIGTDAGSAPLLRALERDGTPVPLLISLAAIGPATHGLKSATHLQVLPAPAAVAAHAGVAGQSVWTSLGEAAGRAVVEALSRSGRRLQPEIALDSLRGLTGYAPLEDAALTWSRSSAHGWRPALWTSSTDQAGMRHSE